MKILNKLKRLCLYAGIIGLSGSLYASPHIEISGVPTPMEANIREALNALDDTTDEDPLEEDFVIERIKESVGLALQPYGYYSPEISVQSGPPLQVSIILGEPVLIESIDLQVLDTEGQPIVPTPYCQDFSLHGGDIFDHDLYENAKKAVLSQAIHAGYLNAYFSEHRVEIDSETHQAFITLHLSLGEIYRFGEVDYSASKLSTCLLDRYLNFVPGEVYAPEKILKLQNLLYQSNYFCSVNIQPQLSEESPVVPIHVELKDAKPNQYIIGAGYGTDTGIRGKLGWNRRYLNSLGHRFAATAQLSQIYHKVEADYIIPGPRPATDFIKVKGAYYQDTYSDKISRLREVGISQEREIHRWKRRLSAFYVQESYHAFENNLKTVSHLISPEIAMIQTVRNDPAAPTHGRRIEVIVRGGADPSSSDPSFIQAYVQFRWLHQITETTKGLLRTEAGFTAPFDVSRIPLSQRFYAGGDLSIRGYGYRMLPEEINPIGKHLPPGAPYLGIISAEIGKTIKAPFGMFGFIDAGNAYRRVAINQTVVGTGLGVEYQTRLGPIKFAIAKPLMKTSNSWRIHASVGPEL